ncbi:MAG: Arylsulfatase [Verrucomicrobiota bacterium]|jgi:arylsulfatase A-like enzyme
MLLRLISLVGFCAFADAGFSASVERPNIVFILADDLGWADVAFNGGNAPTPHLDRLAREGVELRQHYVAPVCSPTRTGFLTGRYWSRFGITAPVNNRALPWDTETLPRALKSVGYTTCLTGKWHLGSLPEEGPNKFGFDHSYGSLAGGVGPWDHHYKQGKFVRTWHRNTELMEEKGHVTDLIANEAIGWMERQPKNTPFFLYVPFTAVHLPVKEPTEWVQRVPAIITGDVARNYAASIMHLDDAVGRIVAALTKAGILERTLLVFTSDNGGSTAENADRQYPADAYPTGALTGNNAPLRGQKGDVFEGGIRVPTVLSWPGKLPARKVEAPCHISDWMPTLCALAGYSPKKDLQWDGMNIWPAITGSAAIASRALYWAGPGFRARAIRDGDWKLIASGSGSKETVALFDLKKDPNERHDLAAAMPDRAKSLHTLLNRIAERDRESQVKE